MRLIVRNVSRDVKFEPRRRAFPRLTSARPVVGGKVIAPGGMLRLSAVDLTESVLRDLELNQRAGNIQVLGGMGTEVDVIKLARDLGHVIHIIQDVAPKVVQAVKAAAVVVDAVKEVVAEIKEAREERRAERAAEQAAPKEEPPPVEPTPAEPAPIEAVIDVAPEAPAPIAPPVLDDKVYTEEELKALGAEDLRTLLARLGGKVTGKNKAELRGEILAAQAAKQS